MLIIHFWLLLWTKCTYAFTQTPSQAHTSLSPCDTINIWLFSFMWQIMISFFYTLFFWKRNTICIHWLPFCEPNRNQFLNATRNISVLSDMYRLFRDSAQSISLVLVSWLCILVPIWTRFQVHPNNPERCSLLFPTLDWFTPSWAQCTFPTCSLRTYSWQTSHEMVHNS